MDKPQKGAPRNVRLWVQLAFTAATNGYLVGFLKGKIFTGKTKGLCVPGLNCYSCPGALGSCPIGALQATLNSRQYRFAFYVFGFLVLVGALVGRLVCGFLCPFGLVQDLLYKIPCGKKRKLLPGDRVLKWLKYFLLAVFVVLLPMFAADITGLGKPWFCEYICPAGTLEAGIPLVLANAGLRSAIGFLYTWKLAILFGIVLLALFFYRPFCRYLCPLGAIYGFFNKISLYRYRVDAAACTHCGACRRACGFDISVWQNPNSADCIRCGACKAACPTRAITGSGPFAGRG